MTLHYKGVDEGVDGRVMWGRQVVQGEEEVSGQMSRAGTGKPRKSPPLPVRQAYRVDGQTQQAG